jgi:hypothetical protein
MGRPGSALCRAGTRHLGSQSGRRAACSVLNRSLRVLSSLQHQSGADPRRIGLSGPRCAAPSCEPAATCWAWVGIRRKTIPESRSGSSRTRGRTDHLRQEPGAVVGTVRAWPGQGSPAGRRYARVARRSTRNWRAKPARGALAQGGTGTHGYQSSIALPLVSGNDRPGHADSVRPENPDAFRSAGNSKPLEELARNVTVAIESLRTRAPA